MDYLRLYNSESDYLNDKSNHDDSTVSYVLDSKEAKFQENGGYFKAIYNVTSTTSSTRLIGSTDRLNDIKAMFIDGEELDLLVNTYTFTTTGLHRVTYVMKECTNMSRMFESCGKLTSLDLSNLDTSKVTDMSYMFYGCSGLTSLDVSNLDTSNVTDMSWMFYGCSGLTSLDVSNLDTSNVTDMSGIFDSCSNLTSLNLSGWDTSNVTTMSYMFTSCNKLQEIIFGENFGSAATSVSCIFTNCGTNDSSIDFTSTKFKTYREMFCGDTRNTINITTLNTSNVTNMSYMFSDCKGLTSTTQIIGFTNLNTSNVTNMERMFQNCYNLTSIDVSNFDTSNVTNMHCMFYDCSGLTSLDLSNFDTSKVIYMNYMFYGCSKLTSLDLSNFNTSKVVWMSHMFGNCTRLASIKFGAQANISKLDAFGYEKMFYGIATTGTLYYPSTYTSAWNNLLVTNQLLCNFPSTWTAQSSYTPSTCTSLTITATDVDSKATSTIISYTAITNGYDDIIQSNIEGFEITGTAISNSFEQNTSTSETVTRTITFEYLGATASTTITQGVSPAKYYTVNLNSQWQLSSSITNPDSSLYEGVYESFSNKGVNYGFAKMTITIDGYSNFKLYIRSYAESTYDYVMVSQLDKDLTSGSTGSTYMKASTSGKQNSSTAITAYTLVEYTNIPEGEHVITVAYRKDMSVNNGDDRGYLLIPKDQ